MIYGDPTNFVALTIAELDDTPLYFTDDIGIVLGLPMDARRGIAWKTCTRIWWAQLDSLIVDVNCCHTRFLNQNRVLIVCMTQDHLFHR
jgi:hypothetical protein